MTRPTVQAVTITRFLARRPNHMPTQHKATTSRVFMRGRNPTRKTEKKPSRPAPPNPGAGQEKDPQKAKKTHDHPRPAKRLPQRPPMARYNVPSAQRGGQDHLQFSA